MDYGVLIRQLQSALGGVRILGQFDVGTVASIAASGFTDRSVDVGVDLADFEWWQPVGLPFPRTGGDRLSVAYELGSPSTEIDFRLANTYAGGAITNVNWFFVLLAKG